MIEVKGKRITDECQYCGEILDCKLFTSGHGINCDRNNVSEMVNCQMEHRSKRMAEERQKECCGTCGCSCYGGKVIWMNTRGRPSDRKRKTALLSTPNNRKTKKGI